jgi:hypothetical protein
MKLKSLLAVASIICGVASTSQLYATDMGEVTVSANRNSARYAQENRPVVGLRRQGDSVVLQISVSSDSRDAEVRKKEIHAVLSGALDRAAASGIEIVTGNYELFPVTKASYQQLPLEYGNRADTNKVLVMLKVKLTSTIAAANLQLIKFVKDIPRSGRGVVDITGGLTLTIINPDQYRDQIIKLVADNARKHAAAFGPDYAVQVSGADQQIAWSQVSDTDVFLYVPYRFTIVPK